MEDVNKWFNSFERTCHSFIKQGKKYKLFVNRKGYTPEHFSIQKSWKERFFSTEILNHTIAVAFLLDDGHILDHLNQTNTKKNVKFSNDYDQLMDWICKFRL